MASTPGLNVSTPSRPISGAGTFGKNDPPPPKKKKKDFKAGADLISAVK